MKITNIIIGAVLLLLMAAIFIGGPLLKVAFIFQAGLAFFLVLIIVIIFLYQKIKTIQKAGKIEQSIVAQTDPLQQNLSPEKRAEIESFKKQLEGAITSLKNSRIGGKKSGKAALYALPWYMIIGPSAAGKTTAIQNSGLEFPFSKASFKGVGGTRNCDWFFSIKGIFLDTAGRYLTQAEDRSEWHTFLDTLQKNRKKRPINGVIVALNIDEIIRCNKAQLNEHSKNIRQRIDELIEHLNVNFPVYMIFTKCDLIQGFIDYFSDLSETERSQIWGATLPFQNQNERNIRDAFDSEFNLLLNRLYEIRATRLNGPLKREQRRRVYLFPYQFKSLQTKLSYLINEIFQNNPYQDNPIFRGFYFTSGTQEGIPLDIAIKEIAKQYNLPEDSDDEASVITETKNYFIKDLLNDVVIGDRNYYAGKSSVFIRKNNSLRLTVALSSLALLVLFSLFTIIGYNRSSSALDRILTASASFANTNWNGNLLSSFRRSENLLRIMDDVKQGTIISSFASFGMDRADKTYDLLERLYLARTESFFRQNIYKEIESVLNKFATGENERGEDIYNYLKSYLLLGNERSRLDTVGQRFLYGIFTNLLETRYINPNIPATPEQKDSLKQYFRNYASFIAYHIKNNNIYTINNDGVLINLVRSKMQYQPSPEELYGRLRQNGLRQFTNDLALEQVIGSGFSGLMKSGAKIPYLFTADGWKNYVQEAVKIENINSSKEDWVLGNPSGKAQVKTFNSDEVRNSMLLLYLNDFKQAWIKTLQSIRYGNFETVPLASGSMKILSDPVNSPLVTILKTFATQLQVIIDVMAPRRDSVKIKNIVYNPSEASNPVISNNSILSETNQYRNLILAPDGSTAKELSSIIAQYGLISGILESIKGGLDLTKDYAGKVLTQRAPEMSAALQVIRGAMYNTPLIQDLFIDPVKLSWKAIVSDASIYLNAQWKAKIFETFNRSMANSFPFKKSGSDVPIQDFKEFFKSPDGTFWTFVNNELGMFVNKDRIRVNQWENEGVSISRELLSAIKRADDISTVLFKNGELNLSFRLKPQLPDSRSINDTKPIIEQVFLSLDNVDSYYKMGAPFWTDYIWPGKKGTPGARMNISIRGYGTSDTKTYEGDWALFRLLDEAKVTPGQTPSQYYLNWNFKKENSYDVIVTYLLSAGSTRNPFSPGFFRSFSLPERIN